MAPLTPPIWSGGRRSLKKGFRLITPEDLREMLAQPGRKPIVLEAHFSSLDHPLDPDQAPRSHLPGAIQVHPSYLEAGTNREKYYPYYDCPSDGNVRRGPKLTQLLHQLGVAPDSHVVVYGTQPDGAMAAARMAWGLLYAGVESVSVLDGGLEGWIEHRGPTAPRVETVWEALESRKAALTTPVLWCPRPEFLATTAEVREIVRRGESSSSKLVDVRRRGEWDGTLTNYYRFYSKAGHIPTAIHQGNWDNFLDPQSCLLAPHLETVAARWCRQGIIDDCVEAGDTTLVFYCGTGWRSSIAFLVAHLLGFRAKNYDDGFYGWSWDDLNEVASTRT